MDNNQVPVMPVPGMPNMNAQAMPMQGQVPMQGQAPMQGQVPAGMTAPMVTPIQNQTQATSEPVKGEKKKNVGLIVSIVLAAVFFIVAVIFIGLFAGAKTEYGELKESVDLKIEQAISEAKMEQALADAEEAKKDTRAFTGPTDYGQLSFEYPKSWSVYVASDASNGGDFIAYLNPLEIEPVSNSTVYALRVAIRDKDFEAVVKEYQRSLDKGELSVETTTVDGVTANRYTGKIPGTELNGVIVIFKIRDKTAVLQTDSALLIKDFDTVLSTVKFNA